MWELGWWEANELLPHPLSQQDLQASVVQLTHQTPVGGTPSLPFSPWASQLPLLPSSLVEISAGGIATTSVPFTVHRACTSFEPEFAVWCPCRQVLGQHRWLAVS